MNTQTTCQSANPATRLTKPATLCRAKTMTASPWSLVPGILSVPSQGHDHWQPNGPRLVPAKDNDCHRHLALLRTRHTLGLVGNQQSELVGGGICRDCKEPNPWASRGVISGNLTSSLAPAPVTKPWLTRPTWGHSLGTNNPPWAKGRATASNGLGIHQK